MERILRSRLTKTSQSRPRLEAGDMPKGVTQPRGDSVQPLFIASDEHEIVLSRRESAREVFPEAAGRAGD